MYRPFIYFLIFFTLILCLGLWFIDRSLASGFKAAKTSKKTQRAVRAGLILIILAQWAAPIAYRAGWSLAPLQWFAYMGLGFLAQLGFLLILHQLARQAPGVRTNRGRRDFLMRQLPWYSLGGATAMATAGAWVARRGPKLKHVTIPFPGLAPGLVGFKIVQISDLHVGQTIGLSYVEKVAALARSANPDLYALTGDFVDGSPAQLAADIAPLKALQAPCGSYFITGNHEYYWNALEWIETFRALGFHPLINQHALVTTRGARLLVTGVTDASAHRVLPEHRSDLQAALAGAPAHDFSLLLAHQPKSVLEAQKEATPIHLQLSGHTHAGQFVPVQFIANLIFRPYFEGLHEHQPGRFLYVNSGTGYWGPPNRLGTTPEVTLIELARG